VTQFGGAIGAELVAVGDFALALRTSRVEVVFAIGTEIEARGNGGGALRALVGKGLANEQINDQTDQKVGRREDENQKGPQAGVHAATPGVAIHIAKHEQEGRHTQGHQRDQNREVEAGQRRAVAEAFVREDGISCLEVVEVDRQAGDKTRDVKRHAEPDKPFRDDAQLFAESGALALAAEADQAETLIQRLGHGFLASQSAGLG